MDLHLRGRFQRLAINLLFGHRRPQPTVTRGLSAHLGVRIDDHRCTTASLRPFIAPCVQQETDVSILAGGRWIENGPYRATIRQGFANRRGNVVILQIGLTAPLAPE